MYMYFVEPILILGGREVLWASVRNHTIILCGVFPLNELLFRCKKISQGFQKLSCHEYFSPYTSLLVYLMHV